MWFSFSRVEGFPTIYSPNFTSVTVDVLEAGWITAFLILFVAFLVAIPTSDRIKNLSLIIRVFFTLIIGLFIMLGNFGQEWEVGDLETRTAYKAGIADEIRAKVGLKIGLRNVNVTLKSNNNSGRLQYETIDYNERFSWEWDQGRFGFGPYAGKLQREFRAAQYRGLPLPILWVVDYFVIDGEGFRFGRFYRTAGWYCHICVWSAFSCWLLSILLFRSVIRYGAYILLICGCLQILANILWAVIRNPLQLEIPFEDGIIRTKFGSSYWITFTSGILCIFISAAILILSRFKENELYSFFGVDPLVTFNEKYLTKEERMWIRKHSQKDKQKSGSDIPLETLNQRISNKDEDDDEDYAPVYLKRVPPPVIRSTKPKHLLNK